MIEEGVTDKEAEVTHATEYLDASAHGFRPWMSLPSDDSHLSGMSADNATVSGKVS
jgi:hypothetical protein